MQAPGRRRLVRLLFLRCLDGFRCRRRRRCGSFRRRRGRWRCRRRSSRRRRGAGAATAGGGGGAAASGGAGGAGEREEEEAPQRAALGVQVVPGAQALRRVEAAVAAQRYRLMRRARSPPPRCSTRSLLRALYR